MTKQDERAVAYAVAKTFMSLINGEHRRGFDSLSAENVREFLYYHINPYCTQPAFDMLSAICTALDQAND